jgi:hypothetical protein
MLLAKPYRDLNPARADEDYRVKLPLSPVWHAKQIHHVTTAEGVAALTRFIDERPISHIGFDTERMKLIFLSPCSKGGFSKQNSVTKK